SKDEIVCQAIAEGYQKNRESFRSFECHFMRRAGFCSSHEAAKIDGPALSATGTWIVDGAKEMFKLTVDARMRKELMQAQMPKPGSRIPTFVVRVPFSSYARLDDGSLIFQHAPDIDGAWIQDASTRIPSGRESPFDMGVMGAEEKTNP